MGQKYIEIIVKTLMIDLYKLPGVGYLTAALRIRTEIDRESGSDRISSPSILTLFVQEVSTYFYVATRCMNMDKTSWTYSI